MRPFGPGTFEVTTPDDVSIVVRRQFEAPIGRVWRAMTDPAHLRRWLASPDFPLTTCEMDVRRGGSYRWVFGHPGSGQMGVRGTFDEVDPPHRMVTTEQFDDFPGPSVNTLTLTEVAGGTAMTLTLRYVDRQMRDGWLGSGMADGLGQGYERLDASLAKVSQAHRRIGV